MDTSSITVQGVVNADRSLEIKQPLPLPPGPVEVTVKSVTQAKEDTLAVLQRIWPEQKSSRQRGRTKEEIDADVQELRDELEDHALDIERLQGEHKPPHE